MSGGKAMGKRIRDKAIIVKPGLLNEKKGEAI